MNDGTAWVHPSQGLRRQDREDVASPEKALEQGAREATQGGVVVQLDAAPTDGLRNETEQPNDEQMAAGNDGETEAVAPGMEMQQADARSEADAERPAATHDAVTGAATETAEDATSQDGMDNLMADFERTFRSPQRGDVLEGFVVSVDKDGVLVDIGTKSEGIIPAHEVQNFRPEVLEEVKVGAQVLVYVLQPENQNGHVVLSLNRARAEKGWRTVQKRFDEGQTIEAEVTDYNRGGLIVNMDGVRGFVPISQVVGLRQDRLDEEELEKRMKEMVGRRISLKVIEVNRGRNRLIMSERLATQEMRVQRKEQLLNELHEGEIRHGRVSSVCDFGAFVDLGGADGLVHLSELSWGQISHPSEVVKVGDEVDCYVLGVDREKKKIALSLRRSKPGPWATIEERYKVGDLVTGTVTKLTSFGAFAKIEDGVEGLIHVSELGEGRIPHPRNVVKEGDVLTLRVIRIEAVRRRLGLSLKQALGEEKPEADSTAESAVEAGQPEALAEVTLAEASSEAGDEAEDVGRGLASAAVADATAE